MKTTMRFEILGPMRVYVGDREVNISAERDRIVLAMLLLHAGKSVSVDQLIEAVWENRPPDGARNQVQGCVSRLRKRLSEAGARQQVIVTDPAGYRIAPHDLDLTRFGQRVREARTAAIEGRHNDARTHYRAALDLWRGAALAGVGSLLVRQATVAIEEDQVQAIEECLELELAAGRAGELVAELTRAVRQHPYREVLHGLLMLALYRAGRQADALAAYRHARNLFREELGAEPGTHLRQLHHAILHRDPSLNPPPQGGQSQSAGKLLVPRELPPPVAGFTGRQEAIKILDECLTDPASVPAPLIISAIAGTAGVGKTALAVQWAHRVADRFPDGQLYVDLHGFSFGPPLRAIDALRLLLGSLGTPPDQIPTDEAQVIARYRSQLAGRRVLVVLDNALSAEQVRPLLPGSPGCTVLVTSRDRLSGLVARDGAQRLTLDVLSAEEATALLTQLIGTERVGREPAAAAELARTCAYLPLALRIAAAVLIDRPHQTVGDLVAELAAGDRLDLMRVDDDEDSAVRTSLQISYERLSTDARRVFRLLGLVPGHDFTVTAAAALADITESEAERLLGKLAAAHLISEHAPGRYAFHDLLRLNAKQIAECEDGADERDAAVERLAGWYLNATYNAVTLLYPQMLELPVPPANLAGPPTSFGQPATALAWLDAERPVLVAAVVYCARYRPRQLAVQLAGCLRRYFMHGQHLLDWLTVADAAIVAAQHGNDVRAQATARMSLADLHSRMARHHEAIEGYHEALALLRRDGWAEGEVAVLTNGGRGHQSLGQLSQASDCFTRALALCEQNSWLPGVALNNNNLGVIDREQGRLAEAVCRHERALAIYQQLGFAVGEADTFGLLGGAHRELGLFSSAVSHLTQALAMHRELGDRQGVALDLESLAAVRRDTGDLVDALGLAQQALQEAADDPDARTRALSALGDVQLRQGLPQVAIGHFHAALDLAHRIGSRHAEAVALLGVAVAHHRLGQHGSAIDHAERAAALARETGYRVPEGLARAVLAEVLLSQDAYDKARDQAKRSLEIQQATGHRLGQARALAVLGRVARKTDGAETAESYLLAAAEILTEIGVPAGAIADGEGDWRQP